MGRVRVVPLAAAAALCLAVAGCASSSSADPAAGGSTSGLTSSRAAYDAIGRLRVDCSSPVIGDQAGLPYTSVSCVGLRIDWMDDVDGYRDLVAADCAATPADQRPALSRSPLVVGDRWVLRGADPTQPGAWPRAVNPQDAADDLGGTVTDAADYCRASGAWA
jgi:hypothetical protein